MIGSVLLDQFFRTILAQLRLLFPAAPDERRFQLPWIERNRELCELIVAGGTQACYQETFRLPGPLGRSTDRPFLNRFFPASFSRTRPGASHRFIEEI